MTEKRLGLVLVSHDLSLAAWIDAVDLSRHLITGTEPGFANETERRARVVLCKVLRICLTMFLQRVPDSIICARFRKMITAVATRGALRFDQLGENRRGTIDRCMLGNGVTNDHNTRTRIQRPRPFLPERVSAVAAKALAGPATLAMVGPVEGAPDIKALEARMAA